MNSAIEKQCRTESVAVAKDMFLYIFSEHSTDRFLIVLEKSNNAGVFDLDFTRWECIVFDVDEKSPHIESLRLGTMINPGDDNVVILS